MRRFSLKSGINFAHFSLESGMVLEGATGVYERSFLLQFRIKIERKSNIRIQSAF